MGTAVLGTALTRGQPQMRLDSVQAIVRCFASSSSQRPLKLPTSNPARKKAGAGETHASKSAVTAAAAKTTQLPSSSSSAASRRAALAPPGPKWGIQLVLEFLKTQKIMKCVVFDVSHISLSNDYTIVLSVPSTRSMQSLSTKLIKLARDNNARNQHVMSISEDPDGLWNIVDLCSIWVHVMVDSARSMPACQRVERMLLRDARLIPVKNWHTLTDAWEDLERRLEDNPPPKYPGSNPPPGWGIVGHGPPVSGLRASLAEDTDDELELFGESTTIGASGSTTLGGGTLPSSASSAQTRNDVAKFGGRLLHGVSAGGSSQPLKVDIVGANGQLRSTTGVLAKAGTMAVIQDVDEDGIVEDDDDEDVYDDDYDDGFAVDEFGNEDDDDELEGLTDITEVAQPRVRDSMPNVIVLDEEDDELLLNEEENFPAYSSKTTATTITAATTTMSTSTVPSSVSRRTR